MSDLTVRAPCEHGHYDAHAEIRCDYKGPGSCLVNHTPIPCPGGREIVLRRPDWYGDRPGGDATEPLSVWVEVDDDATPPQPPES